MQSNFLFLLCVTSNLFLFPSQEISECTFTYAFVAGEGDGARKRQTTRAGVQAGHGVQEEHHVPCQEQEQQI